MTSLVHSSRRRVLVVGLVVASFAAATGSASAAPELVQGGYGPPGGGSSAKTRTLAKIPKRPKAVQRIAIRCDVPVGTAHAGDLWRCE